MRGAARDRGGGAVSPETFAAFWRLASAHGHHWAYAVGEALRADAIDDEGAFGPPDEPHPYRGLPCPPGRATEWTRALIEAVALASPTGPCGGIMAPPAEGETYSTGTGRLEWRVSHGGIATLHVCRPPTESGREERSAVLIAEVRHDGELTLTSPVGHWRGHPELGPEARHVEVLACAVAALRSQSPCDALDEIESIATTLRAEWAANRSRWDERASERDAWVDGVLAACADLRATWAAVAALDAAMTGDVSVAAGVAS